MKFSEMKGALVIVVIITVVLLVFKLNPEMAQTVMDEIGRSVEFVNNSKLLDKYIPEHLSDNDVKMDDELVKLDIANLTYLKSNRVNLSGMGELTNKIKFYYVPRKEIKITDSDGNDHSFVLVNNQLIPNSNIRVCQFVGFDDNAQISIEIYSTSFDDIMYIVGYDTRLRTKESNVFFIAKYAEDGKVVEAKGIKVASNKVNVQTSDEVVDISKEDFDKIVKELEKMNDTSTDEVMCSDVFADVDTIDDEGYVNVRPDVGDVEYFKKDRQSAFKVKIVNEWMLTYDPTSRTLLLETESANYKMKVNGWGTNARYADIIDSDGTSDGYFKFSYIDDESLLELEIVLYNGEEFEEECEDHTMRKVGTVVFKSTYGVDGYCTSARKLASWQ